MSIYLDNIIKACFFFPVLAAIMTLPYVIGQYRKYGATLLIRTAVVYSFVLYLLCAYFMVILPLPSREAVAQMTSPTAQLIPFEFIASFFKESGFVFSDTSTWLPALKDGSFFTVAFNALLFMPFGIYLRYYFEKDFKRTVLWSFLLSLFFELTQLTGLYWLYSRPYRLFDVDDLIINTLGGLLGYVITPLFLLVLPKRERLDEMSYKKGEVVSLTRRTIAAAFDWLVIAILLLSVKVVSGYNVGIFDIMFSADYRATEAYIGIVAAYFMVMPWLLRGRTLGKMLVKIRLRTDNGKTPRLYQLFIRYAILYYLVIPAPFMTLKLIGYLPELSGKMTALVFAMCLFFVVVFATFIIRLFLSSLGREKRLSYAKLSHTSNVSTIIPHYIAINPESNPVSAEAIIERESEAKSEENTELGGNIAVEQAIDAIPENGEETENLSEPAQDIEDLTKTSEFLWDDVQLFEAEPLEEEQTDFDSDSTEQSDTDNAVPQV